jgi:DNA-binding ferritin-like protein
MIKRRSLPFITILLLFTAGHDGIDAQQLEHRGFMIDMTRMKEADEYYFDLVDQLALFGYNALYLHFTDDQGLTVVLNSHPELVSSYAMSQETIRRLIQHAASAGIEIIPEVEAWGHAGWILDHHPHLADATDTGTLEMGNEAVYTLLDAVIAEVTELFTSSRYIHIGMDEAWFPAVPDTTPELDRQIAAHVNRVAEMVRSRDRTPMMWADMVTHRPRVLDELPRDIVMVDWRYWIHETATEARTLRDAGFPVITAPAIVWYETRVHPGPHNWENLRRMIGTAHELNLRGTVVTAWLPQRYPPGVLPHAMAYAAYLMEDTVPIALSDAMARFTSSYFGTDNPELVAVLVRLAGIESSRADLLATFWSDPESFAGRLTPENRARDASYLARTSGIADAFRRQRAAVQKNDEAYESYVVLAELLEYLGRRRILPAAIQHAIDAAEAERDRGNTGMAIDRLQTMAGEVRALETTRRSLIGRLDAHWDRYRYPDHPLKDGGGANSLMWWMKEESHHAYAQSALIEWLETTAAAIAANGARP